MKKKPEMKKNMGNMKGQAMMEYLLTYGLALFVIVIVLAILVTVVLPALKPPETCQFQQPGFSCSQKQHALVSAKDGKLSVIIQLDNQQGRGVSINSTSCLNEPAGNVNAAQVDARKNDLPQTPDLTTVLSTAGTSTVIDLKCFDANGNQISLGPNANFKGAIGITYKYEDDVTGAPERLAVATLTGTAQAG